MSSSYNSMLFLKKASYFSAISLLFLTLQSFAASDLKSSDLTNLKRIYRDAIQHPQRPHQDNQQDQSRKPEIILPFSRIKEGSKVLEIGAGGGYTTELVSRVIGEKGHVYAETLSRDRIKNGRLNNVTALPRHKLYQLPDVLADQGISEGQLDVVVIFFALHDVMMNTRIDQEEFLTNLYKLLKPGGYFIVLDNAAEPNSGLEYTRQLHRIGENYVRQKIESVGFKLDAETKALRNPKDKLNQSWRSIQGKQDRFAYRFVKP